jgi:hypothetical protein
VAAAVDAAPHREQIIKSLQSPDAKANAKVFVHVLGHEQQVRFSSANVTGLTIDMDGNSLPLTWRDMKETDLIHLALAARADDAETIFHAGALAAAAKLDDQYNRILDLLFQKDVTKARQLGQLTGRR